MTTKEENLDCKRTQKKYEDLEEQVDELKGEVAQSASLIEEMKDRMDTMEED